MNHYMQQMAQALHKVETRQKETILQLDEISDRLQDDNDEHALAMALISAIDIIEDFYRLTIDDPHLSAQSQMMWSAAMKAATAGGLEAIDNQGQLPDVKRHSIESTAYDPTMPNGVIIKTLKCGYLYKNEVLRTAAILLNRKEVE